MVEIKLYFSIQDVCEYLIKLGYSIQNIDSTEFDDAQYSVLIAFKGNFPTYLTRNSLLTNNSVQAIFQRELSRKLLEL